MAYEQEIKDQARALRRDGASVSQIAHSLGVRSTSAVQRWVADVPTPPWTSRPTAKDDKRHEARELRSSGATLGQIAEKLAVSKSSVSVWVRDVPVPEELLERARHARRISSHRWVRERVVREAERQAVKREAQGSVGQISDRELLLLGVVLYWAEGAKDKAYDRREHVVVINSDVQMIALFLRWLDLVGVPEEDRRYRLSIHESADIEAAHTFWSQVAGVELCRFQRPTIKRHRPRTNRRNIDVGYHGCLVVSVCRSRVLYQRIEGWMRGITEAVRSGGPRGARCDERLAWCADPPWGNG